MPFSGCGFQNTSQISYDAAISSDGDFFAEDEASEAYESGDIYVSIQGAVSVPGVYVLCEGARIYELINAAGGLSEGADSMGLNMVEVLSDGVQIYVPFEGDSDGTVSPTVVGDSASDGLVNINTAGLSELKTLPGIGDTRAAAIIEYRSSNGSFQSIDDLKNVSGIKDGIFESLKDLICVK